MRKILIIVLMLSGVVSFAQESTKRELKHNKEANLIEVTYFHDNGVVSQTGAYTEDGKLQGDWFSYDMKGNKIAAASYNNGEKVGKWFFWNDETLTEVDYKDNVIASVNEWTNKNHVATRD